MEGLPAKDMYELTQSATQLGYNLIHFDGYGDNIEKRTIQVNALRIDELIEHVDLRRNKDKIVYPLIYFFQN